MSPPSEPLSHLPPVPWTYFLNAIFSLNTLFEKNKAFQLHGFYSEMYPLRKDLSSPFLSFPSIWSLGSGSLLLRNCRIMHLFSQYLLRTYWVKGPGIHKTSQSWPSPNLKTSREVNKVKQTRKHEHYPVGDYITQGDGIHAQGGSMGS